ncbi:HD family phosphohydrolase [Desulfuromonas carbonis]|uniref:HD domain-containing phosphohydrolase n=1 Tax=Desulfuromonas sp. DDH964 TaxID=1823759 RepID=UPI00078CC187|nr:HD domain-containing phosphohydrolase [Desulfuromonas sp. DDH964]AMV72032.1 response receiver-modulated cyclic diguanylate phosphodiesterase [Desulfuromonas sp. DDH964]
MTTSDQLLKRIELLTRISTALSAEQDTNLLLETILLGAKELTHADGGSLYILEGRNLVFQLVHTTSLRLHMGGSSGVPVNFPPVPLELADGSPNLRMVVTRSVLEDRIINIPDAYADQEFDFSGTRAFDARTGYHSRSLLAVPMKDHENRIIGVLQLINAQDPENGATTIFNDADQGLAAALASQAAVALNRRQLIDGLENLLRSLTQLIANAIDDKSHHTGNHCRRVPAITMALARAVNADTGPIFGPVRFDQKQLDELEIASWLHDCGKMTTPERVVDKSTKLETIFDRIHLVDARLEILRLEAEVARLSKGEAAHQTPSASPLPLEQIDAIRSFLHRCNTGGEFLSESDRHYLAELGRITLPNHDASAAAPLLNEDEIRNLAVPRGTLTDEERQIINNHVNVTYRMLEALPFPEHLQNVPLIAAGHHERMDGKGYPQGIPAGQLPLQTRILAIADVFEALTASDRTYRKANTLSQALTIMARMCAEGHLDPQLFDLFVRSEAYRDYARANFQAEQHDAVDSAALRQIYSPAPVEGA